jgi:hypothetical protein
VSDLHASGLPDFYVVGAGRAGTTSLNHYLAQHPQLCVPSSKSCSHFYACDLTGSPLAETPEAIPEWFIADRARYLGLYAGARPDQLRGDVSPVYLASTRVAGRIAAVRPDAQIIAIMRNPVDRVYSRYVGRRRDGLEPTASFEELVEQEMGTPLVRDDAQAAYLAGGMISHFLRTYLDAFPREQIQIHFFEDFSRDPRGTLSSICRFLKVDDQFPFNVDQIYNSSGGRIRNSTVGGLWAASLPLRRALRPWLPKSLRDAAFKKVTANTEKVPLKPETRARLQQLYRDDIRQLQELTGRDLKAWWQPSGG